MGMKTCPTCGGKGYTVYATGRNCDLQQTECPRCDGRGKIPEDED